MHGSFHVLLDKVALEDGAVEEGAGVELPHQTWTLADVC